MDEDEEELDELRSGGHGLAGSVGTRILEEGDGHRSIHEIELSPAPCVIPSSGNGSILSWLGLRGRRSSLGWWRRESVGRGEGRERSG